MSWLRPLAFAPLLALACRGSHAQQGGRDACSGCTGVPLDARGDAHRESSPVDAHVDALHSDARLDATPVDARTVDARPVDARAFDARPVDARAIDARPPDAPPIDAGTSPQGAVLYPLGRAQSPITAAVAAHVASIAGASTAPRVFAKIGDSMTATTSFLTCFDGSYDLGTHSALAATRDYFAAGNAAGTTPYSRVSLAATGGWQTRDELVGSPTPLDHELTAITPRIALVLLGTNDNRYGRSLDAFAQDLWTITDHLIAAGTVPVLSTIAPVNGDPSTDARVPLFNLAVRAIAQGRQVPLVDLHDALLPLPGRGIGSDGIHPTVAGSGACDLTAAGLQYGYDVRNLLTLEALDRTRGALAGQAADATAPVRAGAGTQANPYLGSLPLVDLADTRMGESLIDTYPSCDNDPHTGRELVYRLDLASAQTIDAYVIDRGSVDVDVHILQGSLGSNACVASGDTLASATVGPGLVYLVVDSVGPTAEGEFLLVVSAH